MIDSIVVETKTPSDNLVKIVRAVEEAKADFIKKARGDVPTELINSPEIYAFLVNHKNYPASPELLKTAAAVYVGFVLGQSTMETTKGLPTELMKNAILHTLQKHNLAGVKVLDYCPFFMGQSIEEYLVQRR